MIDNPGESGLTAIIGALGLKLIEKAFRMKRRTLDDASAIRKELRDAMAKQDEKITDLYGELDQWREKYYRMVETNSELKAECISLRSEVQILKAKAQSRLSVSTLDS